jgi:hypothetical protein
MKSLLLTLSLIGISGCTTTQKYIGLKQYTLPILPTEKRLKVEKRGAILIKNLRKQNEFYRFQVKQNNNLLKENNATHF